MSMIFQLQFVETTFKVGPSSPSQRHQNCTPCDLEHTCTTPPFMVTESREVTGNRRIYIQQRSLARHEPGTLTQGHPGHVNWNMANFNMEY